jgi:hypothetical protein
MAMVRMGISAHTWYPGGWSSSCSSVSLPGPLSDASQEQRRKWACDMVAADSRSHSPTQELWEAVTVQNLFTCFFFLFFFCSTEIELRAPCLLGRHFYYLSHFTSPLHSFWSVWQNQATRSDTECHAMTRKALLILSAICGEEQVFFSLAAVFKFLFSCFYVHYVLEWQLVTI